MSALRRVLLHPLTYVLGMSVYGSAGIVAGVALVAGTGWALITGGVLLIAGAGFITRGMRTDA